MPTSVQRSARMARQNIGEGGGIKICCCRVFTCFNLNFLSTNHGLMKVSEVILGTCCQTLLVRFGLDSASDIGQAFNTCLTTVSSCLMTSSLLLFCYILSTRTFNLVRQSLFVSISNGRPNDTLTSNISYESITLGNLLQSLCLLYVLQCVRLHGIYRLFLALSQIWIAACLYGLPRHDSCLRKFFYLTLIFSGQEL